MNVYRISYNLKGYAKEDFVRATDTLTAQKILRARTGCKLKDIISVNQCGCCYRCINDACK
jgi:hypothetical protein